MTRQNQSQNHEEKTLRGPDREVAGADKRLLGLKEHWITTVRFQHEESTRAQNRTTADKPNGLWVQTSMCSGGSDVLNSPANQVSVREQKRGGLVVSL